MNEIDGDKKRCSICDELKPFNEFYLYNGKYDSRCKRCKYLSDKKYQKPYIGRSTFDRSHRWTDMELDILKEKYPTTGALELGKILHVSPYSIYHKARSIGIKKWRKSKNG